MPAKQDPRSGLFYGWALGESGWNTGMDYNLLLLGRIGFHPTVKSRAVADPSTITPTEGDGYIVAASAVGEWEGHDGAIAVRLSDGWEFYSPRPGVAVLVEDEEVRSTYLASGWTAGVAV